VSSSGGFRGLVGGFNFGLAARPQARAGSAA